MAVSNCIVWLKIRRVSCRPLQLRLPSRPCEDSDRLRRLDTPGQWRGHQPAGTDQRAARPRSSGQAAVTDGLSRAAMPQLPGNSLGVEPLAGWLGDSRVSPGLRTPGHRRPTGLGRTALAKQAWPGVLQRHPYAFSRIRAHPLALDFTALGLCLSARL